MKDIFNINEFDNFRSLIGIPKSIYKYFHIYRLEDIKKIENDFHSPFFRQYFFDITIFCSLKNSFDFLYGAENHKIQNATLQLVAPYQIQKLDVPLEVLQSVHGYTINFKYEFLSIGVDKSNFLKDFPFFKLDSTANVIELNQLQEKSLINLCERMQYEYENGREEIRSEEIIKGYLWAFLNDCLRIFHSSNYGNQFELDGYRPQIIADNFREQIEMYFKSKTMVQEYAELMNITPNHLTQTIKDVTGKKAKDFITERRIIEAKRLLKFTSDSIAEIAYNIGFEEPTHFIRFFKKNTSLTPKEYKNGQM